MWQVVGNKKSRKTRIVLCRRSVITEDGEEIEVEEEVEEEYSDDEEEDSDHSDGSVRDLSRQTSQDAHISQDVLSPLVCQLHFTLSWVYTHKPQ